MYKKLLDYKIDNNNFYNYITEFIKLYNININTINNQNKDNEYYEKIRNKICDYYKNNKKNLTQF
jgi:hypothetical protein